MTRTVKILTGRSYTPYWTAGSSYACAQRHADAQYHYPANIHAASAKAHG